MKETPLTPDLIQQILQENHLFLSNAKQLEFSRKLTSTFNALPENTRTVLKLKFTDCKTVREIAGIIGRSESRTRSLLAKGKHRLRIAIDIQYQDKYLQAMKRVVAKSSL